MSETLRDIKMPDLEDPLYAPFWEGTRQGKIMVQCCSDCGTRRWPARHMCWNCQSFATEWVEEKQQGKLFSWTVVGHATAKGYPDVPYVVGIVEIDPVTPIRLAGYVGNIDFGSLKAGLPLKARFEPAGPKSEMTLIQWEPDTGA